MRVTKNSDGSFAVEDKPMQLEGEAAEQFLAMVNDQTPETLERKRFREECERAYETAREKLAR